MLSTNPILCYAGAGGTWRKLFRQGTCLCLTGGSYEPSPNPVAFQHLKKQHLNIQTTLFPTILGSSAADIIWAYLCRCVLLVGQLAGGSWVQLKPSRPVSSKPWASSQHGDLRVAREQAAVCKHFPSLRLHHHIG